MSKGELRGNLRIGREAKARKTNRRKPFMDCVLPPVPTLTTGSSECGYFLYQVQLFPTIYCLQ